MEMLYQLGKWRKESSRKVSSQKSDLGGTAAGGTIFGDIRLKNFHLQGAKDCYYWHRNDRCYQERESRKLSRPYRVAGGFASTTFSSNIVKLIGHCSEDKERLHVYEFMQKGSLEDHLFRKNPETEAVLSWDNRLKIALGAARALSFLHSLQTPIIHRDFKTSNISLDENYNAKLSGFELAKLGPSDGESYVETQVMGTYGYAAPEYIATGCLYVKSDVYRFGVVLLEILTGLRVIDRNRPSQKQNLVDWGKPLLSDKSNLETFMDAKIKGQYSSKEALEMAKITRKCLVPDPKVRPSMKEVVDALEQIQATRESSE
ncbi:LOW QUALITY PROTEIN: probable serine/threonine-protein kinase CST [Argentina anserina]|uniref:LOW QUALITY PROTEIN: probable serine/threonine-protein kinase CST n=1 Tax=Argentina anserina TaxID=57926 RepID=UPI00217632F8|nr:LOW QUALITY PROTEIN: probable serine/threonine-protein kinase CST [Potentilla anserina]